MDHRGDRAFAPERYRNYLRALAAKNLNPRAQAKFDASDLVQQTLLDAVRVAGQFRGLCEAEMVAWLRRLLTCNLVDARRALGRTKRDATRELSLDRADSRTRRSIQEIFACGESTPSRRIRRDESAAQLAQVLQSLPELNRQVITMRHLEGCSISVIAERLGRTPTSVAGLLKRGLAQLRVTIPAELRPS